MRWIFLARHQILSFEPPYGNLVRQPQGCAESHGAGRRKRFWVWARCWVWAWSCSYHQKRPNDRRLIGPDLKQWLADNPPRPVAELDDAIERSKARSDYDLRTLKQTRRHLSDRRMDRLMKRLKEKYRLVYPKLADGATTIVPSTEDFQEMIKRSLGAEDLLPVNKFISEEQNDAHERRIETSEENRDRFFAMQKSMNTHTVITNDYGTACERLNLDPANFLVPGQYTGQTGPQAQLKPHQVVALDWILEIEKVLGGAILAKTRTGTPEACDLAERLPMCPTLNMILLLPRQCICVLLIFQTLRGVIFHARLSKRLQNSSRPAVMGSCSHFRMVNNSVLRSLSRHRVNLP